MDRQTPFELQQGEVPVVVVHGGCSDGMCAAAVLHSYLFPNVKADADTLRTFYTSYPGKVIGTVNFLAGRYSSSTKVLFFDVAVNQAEFVALLTAFPRAEVHDHHESTKECKPHPQLILDMTVSGAVLACRYARVGCGQIYLLVQYVQDRDLWNFTLPSSKEVNRYLHDQLPPRYDSMDKWLCYLKSREWVKEAMEKGSLLVRSEDRIITDAIKNAAFLNVGPHKVVAINSQTLRSDVGARASGMFKEFHYVMVWYYSGDANKVYVSLRSDKYNPIAADVNEVAKSLGNGGGHRHAAGCEFTWEEMGKILANRAAPPEEPIKFV